MTRTMDSLYQAIPKSIPANINFRTQLHSYLVRDDKAKIDFLARCFVDPRIMFNSCFWCPATESNAISPNVPFILYPHQETAVLEMKKAIDFGYDIVADKSRKEGATFIVCGLGMVYWLLKPGFKMLWGSRVEDLVDKGSNIIDGVVVGDEASLFYKLLYLYANLPLYLQPRYQKSHMAFQNLENEAAHSGKATSIAFGKASRAMVIMVDELAAIEPRIAQTLIENIPDVSNCCIFNSTQGDWGSAHPYAKMLVAKKTKTVVLDYTSNPTKNPGLYDSPESGKLRILDIDYYRKRYPGKFDQIENDSIISIDEVKDTYPFIVDGGIETFHRERSPWLDAEYKRPGRTRRGMAQNVLRIPAGSSDLFFRYDLLEHLRDGVKSPLYHGNIEYQIENGEVANPVFAPGGSKSNLSWWDNLPSRRPNQNHNYAVGCDLSKGTGSSNSVAAVVDVNENELVGLLVTPYHRLEQFAELVVALCEWIGGVERPLLSWETNGATDFSARIDELGYYNLWDNGKKGYGWRSSGGPQGTKIELLNSFEAALFESLKEKTEFNYLRIYDAQTIIEMGQYVFFEGRVDVGPATMQTESSGAKSAHGDRVIGVAIACLCAKQQTPGKRDQMYMADEGSFMDRKARKEQLDNKNNKNNKKWWI